MRRYCPAVLPAALLLVTALISITGPGFSWDEVATADIAGRTPAQIWALMRHVDAVIGPYYLFMHAWTAVAGTTETALRLPQVIAMALAAGVTGELGRRLCTPLTGLTAGLLLVIMPNTYRYAAEARPYAFSVLFAALSLLLLHAALARPARWRWLLYAGSVLLLGLSHIVGVSVLAAHALIVLLRARRLLWAWAAAAGPVVLLLAPLALLGAGQQDGQVAWIKPLTVAALRRSPADLVGSAAAAWLLIGLVLLVRHRRVLLELAALCVVPAVALAGYSLLVGPLWVPRYLLIVLPPLALLAAAATVGTATAGTATAARPSQAAKRSGPAGGTPAAKTVTAGTVHPAAPVEPAATMSLAATARPPASTETAATAEPAPEPAATAEPPATAGTAATVGVAATAGPPAAVEPEAAARRVRVRRRVTGPRGRVWVTVGLVLAVVLAAAWPEQRQQRADLAKNGSDYRALTRAIQARDLPGDAILYQDGNRALRAGVDFYYGDDPARPADVLLRRTAGQAGRLAAEEHTDVAGHLAGRSRVWLVVASTGREDPLIHKPRAAPVLRAGFRRTALFTVHGATVACYQRRP